MSRGRPCHLQRRRSQLPQRARDRDRDYPSSETAAVVEALLYRLLRPGTLLIGVVLFEVPVLLALVAPFGAWWVGLVCVCFGIGVPAIRVLIDVLIVRQIPDDQRGRALSGVITLFT